MLLETLLSLSIPLAPPAPQEPEAQPPANEARTVETWSLSSLLESDVDGPPPPLGSVLRIPGRPVFGHQDVRLIGGSDAGGPRLNEGILEEFLETLHGDAVAGGDLSLQVQGSTLYATGTGKHLRALDADLRWLEARLGRTLKIEAAVFEWEGAAPPSVLDAAAWNDLAREHEPLWRGVLQGRAGGAHSLGRVERRGYVYDAETEIAAEAAIGNPSTREFFDGLQVVVEPHALVGSEDIVVLGHFAVGSETRPMSSRSTRVEGLPALDVPHLALACGSFSGRVASGGALAVTCNGNDHGGARVLLVVSARWLAPPAGQVDGAQIVPLSALTTVSLQRRVRRHRHTSEGDRSSQNHLVLGDDTTRGYGSFEADALLEILRALRPDVTRQVDVTLLTPGHLTLLGPREASEPLVRVVRDLQDRFLRNSEIRMTVTTEQTVTDEGPYHRLVLPALMGRNHFLVRGTETTQINDYHVDVAQDATIADPVVRPVFSGSVLTARSHPGSSGPALDATLDVVHADEPVRRSTEDQELGDLYRARTEHTSTGHSGPMPRQGALDLGEGPRIRTGRETRRSYIRLALRTP